MARTSDEPVSSPRQHEVFQPKHGLDCDLSSSKVSEILKSNSVDNAPTQSLLNVVRVMLDESIEKNNGELSDKVACLLRKIVEEIERRISKQADHIRNLNNIFKAREEKYESRIQLLETLAAGSKRESQVSEVETLPLQTNQSSNGVSSNKNPFSSFSLNKIVENQLQQMKHQKAKSEDRKRQEDHDLVRVMKEKEDSDNMVANLRAELEMKNKSHGEYCFRLETMIKETTKELDDKRNLVYSTLEELENTKKQLETKNKSHEEYCFNLEATIKETKSMLEEKTKELDDRKELCSNMEELDKMKKQLETKSKSQEEYCFSLETMIKETKSKLEEKTKELDDRKEELCSTLEELDKTKKQLETKNKSYEEYCYSLEAMIKETKSKLEEKTKELNDKNEEVCFTLEELDKMKKELETKSKSHEKYCSTLEAMVKETESKLEEKTKELDEKKEEVCSTIEELDKTKKQLETKSKSHEEYCSSLEAMVKETESKLEDKTKELDEKKEEVSSTLKELDKTKKQLETKSKSHEEYFSSLEAKVKETESKLEDKTKELDDKKEEVCCTIEELDKMKKLVETKSKSHEEYCSRLEALIKEAESKLQEKTKEVYDQKGEVCSTLVELNKTKKQLEMSESRLRKCEKKEDVFKNLMCFQLQGMQDLRMESDSIKDEVLHTQSRWIEEYIVLTRKVKELAGTAEICHSVLEENRKIYNELQDLKGNIRVYCRIRPFNSSKAGKASIVDYIGEDGELLVANPSKPGKEGQRMFKFNKVFGPSSSQEEVYLDTRPLIRSILDGFNVCIFAYGQTGSGKTYTMSGPNSPTKEKWGVNYRALNDLFQISEARKNSFTYEVDVQMVEIYNEQVRDLLANDGQSKKLGIRNATQQNGLVVPDACVRAVNSTEDVVELMIYGQTNRASSATALNERSSRSHSVLSVHVRGVDLKTKSQLRGCLHLVDLAGSERVNRSEVAGDRLKEAQHINKSLSALGDVISALSQKSSHVPYRNSKLTQLLQSSLGGRAKTLMFVQMNPDAESFSETLSTLKFAERVSGVELGAARSSKDGKEIKDLMDQLAFLKDTITRKDEEIEQLQLLKQ